MPHVLLLTLLSSVCLGTGCTTPPPESLPSQTCDDMALITDFRGLWLNPNPLSAPDGAVSLAVNVVSTRPGVAECRPGQEMLSGVYADNAERLRSGKAYQGYGIESTGTNLYRRTPSTGAVAAIGAAVPAGGPTARMRFTVAGDDLYMATSTGIRVMDGSGSIPVAAGVAAPLDIIEVASSNGIGAYSAGAVASATITLGGSAGNVTVVVNGTSVGPVAFSTSDTVTATNVASAINANGSISALVTANAVGTVITLTATSSGSIRNTITLSASRTAGSATVSGPTLTGGTSRAGAYRVTLVRQDAEGRFVESAPSGRAAYVNAYTSGVHGAVLRVALPSGLPGGTLVRAYRTTVVDDAVNPGDVMYLAAERPLTSGEISAGWAFVTDSQPDALLGTPLYTNVTSALGGITMANGRPPMGSDVALYRQSLVVAQVTAPHRLLLRMLAPMNEGDTITIAGVTYLAASPSVTEPPTVASGQVVFKSTTALTTSENIESEARSLIRVINRTNSGIYASYVSGENDAPGFIALERRNTTDSAFTAQSGVGTLFEPVITTAVPSTQDVRLNGLSFSKPGLPYAFPSNTAYQLRLGAADARILRIIPNRDSLFVFKEDGVWVVYESGSTWSYRQISTDVVLLFPDSVAVMDNQVYAFTNQGVMAVDENGLEQADGAVRQATQAIQDAILSASGGPSPASLFAVADSVRLRYTLWHASGSGSGLAADHALVYNGATDTWTERDDLTTGGYIGPDGLLYLGVGDLPQVSRQRNTGTASDYKSPANGPINVELEWLKLVDPSGSNQFTELRLLTEEPTSGDYDFTFTSHYNESESVTGEGENLPEVRVWVPDGVQRTTRLRARVSRDVFEEYLVVVGVADAHDDYRGPPTRG